MVILVTGGSSGIGQSICEYLTQKGHIVYGTSRKVSEQKHSFNLIEMDVQNDVSVRKAIAQIINKEGRIDVLVNNAGLGIAGPLEETDIETIKTVFDTNVFGIIRTCQSVIPYMRRHKFGHIINVSSIAGELGLPFRGIYSASKSSVEMISEAMRMEVKDFNIKVSVIQPGDFKTNINQNRLEVNENKVSSYHKKYEGVRKQVMDEVATAQDPIIVGQKIEKIITMSSPSIRYPIAPFLQKLTPVLKKILPYSIFEKLIMNHYKM